MDYFLLLLLIALAATIAFSIRQAKRTREAWAAAARELGLEFAGWAFAERPRIRGTLRGFDILVQTVTRGSGKNSTTYTRFRVGYPEPLPIGLRLSREGFFSGVAKLFGAQDIEIGDAAFDREVVVKGTDPKAIARFLTPARRARIRRLLSLHPEASIDRGAIVCERRGVERDPARLAGTIRLLLRVAWSLAADRKEDESFAKAVDAENAGRVEEALAILRTRTARTQPSPPPEVEPVEERLLEAELLRLGGQDAEAKEIVREALREIPDDREARAWAEHLDARPAAGAPEGRAAPPAVDVKSVCETLFDPKNSSIDATRLFEKTYRGAPIAWTGKLRSTETSAYDFVFGPGEAVKATFEVFRVPATLFGEREVLAIVRLPKSAAAELEGRSGTTFAFEGKLLEADGFVRNLYVTDGRLIGPVEG